MRLSSATGSDATGAGEDAGGVGALAVLDTGSGVGFVSEEQASQEMRSRGSNGRMVGGT